MQAKLHRWAAADPGRRFDDLFNLVHDPVTLIVAWDRVATNRGAAIDVLADRRMFAIDDAAWGEFLAVLDRPVSHKPRLAKLFAEPSVFTEA